MGGYSVPVAPGKSPTQLGGAPLVKGATIANQDTTNGVWVASSSNVSPGNGQFIGPLGNGQWNNDSAIAYACVDTGVTSTVSVVVSGDVSGVTNPVALAAATAGLLLTQGVLTVFQGDIIESGAVPFNTVFHTVPGDLSSYASVAVNLGAIGPQQALTFIWLTAPGGSEVTQHTFLATGLSTNLGSNIELVLPVEAPTLRIYFPNKSAPGPITGTSILVYASTRPASPSVRKLDLSVDYTRTQSWVPGTPVNMGPLVTNGGLHSARMLTSTANGIGYFGYQSSDSVGNVSPIYLFKTAAAQDAYLNVVLPRGCVELIFLPANTVNPATYVAEFSISPPGS